MKRKEKVIEILKELIPPPSTWLGHPEDRIPTWENRLNRAAIKICSPQQPSEEEINNIAKEVADKYGKGLYGDYYVAAKIAIKMFIKLKL